MPTLLAKLITYHLVLLGALLAVLYFFPQLEPYLPVGGLMDFDSDSATFEEVVTTYRSTTTSDTAYTGLARLATALMMSTSLLATLLVMLPISWAYKASHLGKKVDRTILETLFILPIVITAVVLLIKNSVALAFGLAGIVAGVQYRNRLKLSSDAAYLFAAIAVGIASGVRAIGVAVIMSLWFCGTIVALRLRDAPKEDADRTNAD